MRPEPLHVVTAVANPIRWKAASRWRARRCLDGSRSRTSHVTLAECAYGGRGYQLADLAGARVTHVPLRATTMAWSKENLINLAISRLPPSRVQDRHARRRHRVPQEAGRRRRSPRSISIRSSSRGTRPTTSGRTTSTSQAHTSFASVYHAGKPVVAPGSKFWTFNGGPYDYPHQRLRLGVAAPPLDAIGGLFEDGGMGSGDHHMALAMVGPLEASFPGGVTRGLSQRGDGLAGAGADPRQPASSASCPAPSSIPSTAARRARL